MSCVWACFLIASHTVSGYATLNLEQILSVHSNCIWSRLYACLGVTCHLHFWQNDQSFSCHFHKTCVVWSHGHRTRAQKFNSGEEKSSTGSVGYQTCDLITSLVLYHPSCPILIYLLQLMHLNRQRSGSMEHTSEVPKLLSNSLKNFWLGIWNKFCSHCWCCPSA